MNERSTPQALHGLLVLVSLLAVAAAGCRGQQVYEGRFESSFETSALHPCGSGETWWVRADSAAWAKLHAPPAELDSAGAPGPPASTAFVRLRGDTTPPGEYGHLGAYARRIEVSEVLEVWSPGERECPG